ncbi:MAG TPA: hypothetical protein VFA66_13670 [Gaiellaceae bacterium]|nr:hypothetical protein [Gaiellaceae bacterium]
MQDQPAYVVVADIPVSWLDYCDRPPVAARPGLLVEVAGPTEEGVRRIEIWHPEAGPKTAVSPADGVTVRVLHARRFWTAPAPSSDPT